MAFAKPKSRAVAETKRVGRFGIVGILNTLIDFSIFNLLISAAGFARIPANLVSTSVAMSFSFVANKTFVFSSKQKQLLRQAILFILITAFGLYVIQNSIIFILSEKWLAPLNLANSLVHALGLSNVFSQQFVISNGAKAVATLFSLSWNYLMYRRFVFKK